jgi:tetratricopeptide (TPR) repeat protein
MAQRKGVSIAYLRDGIPRYLAGLGASIHREVSQCGDQCRIRTEEKIAGRREEALAAATEAVTIRRDLARARPEAFTPDLAMSLNNLANRLSELGQREEALAAATEAAGLYRDLARARPEAFTPDLAGSLNNLANRLSELGQREEALAAAARQKLPRLIASSDAVHKLTLAARKEDELSDADVLGMLEDLKELGVIPPDDEPGDGR